MKACTVSTGDAGAWWQQEIRAHRPMAVICKAWGPTVISHPIGPGRLRGVPEARTLVAHDTSVAPLPTAPPRLWPASWRFGVWVFGFPCNSSTQSSALFGTVGSVHASAPATGCDPVSEKFPVLGSNHWAVYARPELSTTIEPPSGFTKSRRHNSNHWDVDYFGLIYK